MMKKHFLVAMAAMAVMATACQKEETVPQQEELAYTPISINATYGGAGSKVSYTEEGNTISATWQEGDQILVVYDGQVSTLTMTSAPGSASASFSGTIAHRQSATPSSSSVLSCYVKDVNNPGALTVSDGNVIYSDASFLSQNGTLAGAGKCNLFFGMATYGTGENISCTFGVSTSMLKFTLDNLCSTNGATATLAYKSGDDVLARAEFTFNENSNTYYLAVPAGQYSGVQALVYTCEGDTMTEKLSTTHANFSVGQTYSKTIDMINHVPLTFEAKDGAATVKLVDQYGMVSGVSFQYKKSDGSDWQEYEINDPISLNVGQKVSFKARGTNSATGYSNTSRSLSFNITSGQCYAYGNVMSLLDAKNYAEATTLSDNYTFSYLFRNCTGLYSHSTHPISLPATTLSNRCYSYMFSGCTHLTIPPALPATHLAQYCYVYMFYGCTALTAAPELPATSLAEYCYQYMFHGCTSLTSAPALPATSLANYCYRSMFSGCSALTEAPVLPATTMKPYCYYDMFQNCTALTTAPVLPATNLDLNCYYRMFDGCTGLTIAPELPAMTLAEKCYYYMFSGCTGLTTVRSLPATNLANYCYSYMFNNCSSLVNVPDTLPAMTLAPFCYAEMFINCSSLVTAPVLPAPTLVEQCYVGMFQDCISLRSLTCLATEIDARYSHSFWVRRVPSGGTFTAANSSVNWGSNSNGDGIPTGWTRVNLN